MNEGCHLYHLVFKKSLIFYFYFKIIQKNLYYGNHSDKYYFQLKFIYLLQSLYSKVFIDNYIFNFTYLMLFMFIYFLIIVYYKLTIILYLFDFYID